MSKYYYDESQNILNLVFDGELVIGNINEIKTLLSEAFAKSDAMVVNHSSAKEFDFAYLQLLVSARKTAALTGKKFKIDENSPEDFKILVKDSGFTSTILSPVI